ncbi:hypothetical protein AV530_014316 [Patagioenas fasciata monilis]|uniref:Uncharacterized protein n=1 Tax=Patagioenas fasciata monilis TaxID=372326 RepID=A0A1V4KB93_PATFA|nr:hypothetical protein AV530_014316 [Patagioenas fasciata monilis]
MTLAPGTLQLEPGQESDLMEEYWDTLLKPEPNYKLEYQASHEPTMFLPEAQSEILFHLLICQLQSEIQAFGKI